MSKQVGPKNSLKKSLKKTEGCNDPFYIKDLRLSAFVLSKGPTYGKPFVLKGQT